MADQVRAAVMSHAMVICRGNRDLAHDLYQNAWISALRAFPAFRSRTSGAVVAYMRGAITNGYINHLRRQRRLTSLDEALEAGLQLESRDAENGVAASLPADLRQKLGILEPRLQRLMSLFAQGYSAVWIADALGLNDEYEYRQLFDHAVAHLRQAEVRAEPIADVATNLPILRRYDTSLPGVGAIHSMSGIMTALGIDSKWVQRHLKAHQPVALVGDFGGLKPRYSDDTFGDLRRRRGQLDAVPYATSRHATRRALTVMLDPPQSWQWVDGQLAEMGAEAIPLRTGKSPGRVREHFLVAAVLPELQRRVNDSLLEWKTAWGMTRALHRDYRWVKARLKPFESEGRVLQAFHGQGSNQKKKRYPLHVFADLERQHLVQKEREDNPFYRWTT